MNPNPAACADSVHYELRFASLFIEGRGFAFPCDADGAVDLGGTNRARRRNYLLARAAVGRELGLPAVQPCAVH